MFASSGAGNYSKYLANPGLSTDVGVLPSHLGHFGNYGKSKSKSNYGNYPTPFHIRRHASSPLAWDSLSFNYSRSAKTIGSPHYQFVVASTKDQAEKLRQTETGSTAFPSTTAH